MSMTANAAELLFPQNYRTPLWAHSGNSIANGGVVSRSPTSLITRKFARQSHAGFYESRNTAFHRLLRAVRLGSIPIARSTSSHSWSAAFQRVLKLFAKAGIPANEMPQVRDRCRAGLVLLTMCQTLGLQLDIHKRESPIALRKGRGWEWPLPSQA